MRYLVLKCGTQCTLWCAMTLHGATFLNFGSSVLRLFWDYEEGLPFPGRARFLTQRETYTKHLIDIQFWHQIARYRPTIYSEGAMGGEARMKLNGDQETERAVLTDQLLDGPTMVESGEIGEAYLCSAVGKYMQQKKKNIIKHLNTS